MTNKTSEVTKSWSKLKPIGNVCLHVPCDKLIAVATRAERMEEALDAIIASCQPEDPEDPHNLMEPDEIAKEALAFDPLNSSSPNSLISSAQ